ncbi:MAG: T9SS type A sorting domain-containing protein [Bacteroidetes bacterium]|nr:T9SS type A sorting domain-containing protein [Bacteroidota bacterium]HOV98178.1 glycoside hydrolase family 44 protein [Bacteroidota bacterium]
MKISNIISIILSVPFLLNAQSLQFTITVSDTQKPISPYIYGANPEFTASENLAARRLGGNRLTGYNWENNASNAGSDWQHSSDNYLTWSAGITNENQPGIVATTFHTKALEAGAYSLVTLQMAGYVAKDKNGTVTEDQTAPSSRWAKVEYAKGTPFDPSPNVNDTLVYMDEFVNFLVTTFGLGNTSSGVKGYALDNEPALWQSTHPRIHPNKPTCAELMQRSIALASAVKNVDSTAEIFGPALYGFNAYYSFQNASDWQAIKRRKGYNWFIDYYLDSMKVAEQTYGRRLLDVLDLHWYPEASGDHRITETSATTAADKSARLQAPRTLWDATYREKSWIAQSYSTYLPLIPKVISSINTYYPGTKLAFTEFTYGGENDITGALALADVLGIFGKYGVYLATFWPTSSDVTYIRAAYRLYRNYDGANSTFGNASLPAKTSDSVNTSVYASVNTSTSEIHLITINKDLSNSKEASFTLDNVSAITNAQAWILDGSGSAIRNGAAITTISGNSFSYSLPPASACHFVIQISGLNVEKESSSQPTQITLHTFPNPFNSNCMIEYSVPPSGEYLLEIVDVLGRLVKSISLPNYSGIIRWDGTSQNNSPVASGVYFVVVRGASRQQIQAQRILLLK